MADDAISAARLDVEVAGERRRVYAREIARLAETETYAGTSYVFRLRNANGLIQTTSGSAVSMVVPPASQAPFPIPSRISVAQLGAGQVSFVAGAGVTIRTPETLNLAKQYATATLIALDTDVWLLAGYLEAAA